MRLSHKICRCQYTSFPTLSWPAVDQKFVLRVSFQEIRWYRRLIYSYKRITFNDGDRTVDRPSTLLLFSLNHAKCMHEFSRTSVLRTMAALMQVTAPSSVSTWSQSRGAGNGTTNTRTQTLLSIVPISPVYVNQGRPEWNNVSCLSSYVSVFDNGTSSQATNT
jgi:hypothetical protein